MGKKWIQPKDYSQIQLEDYKNTSQIKEIDELNFFNLDNFINYYKDKILNKLSFLKKEQVIDLLEILHKKPVLTKLDLQLEIGNCTKEISEKVITAIKNKWTTNLELITKWKAIITGDGNNNNGVELSKFYFNTESLSIYKEDIKLFFKNINSYYRKYSLEKIEEFIKSSDNSWIKNIEKLINNISWIIEFPQDYVFLMLKFLNSNDIIQINKENKITFSDKWIKNYSFYKNISDENWFIEISWDLQKYIINEFKNDKNITAQKIKNKILKDFSLEVNLEDIKLLKDNLDKNPDNFDTLQNMSLKILKSKKKYNIDNNNYKFNIEIENDAWEKNRKDYYISIDTIDEIFYLYSERWLNLTQNEVIEYLKLDPNLWNIIKTRLRLIKKSDLFGPHTMDLFWQDENFRQEKIKAITDKYTRDKTRIGVEKSLKREQKAQNEKIKKIYSTQENFKKFMLEIIEKYQPKKIITKFEQIEEKNNWEITISFSDIHFWKNWTGEIIKRLKKVWDYIVSQKETKVNILCLWDLAEALVEWWMHTWQKEKMNWANKDAYEQIMEITNILESFLVWLYRSWKEIDFKWIWWNHDRIWKDHNQDMSRTWALIIYELIKRWLVNFNEQINIEYFVEKWNSFDMQWFRYIIHHWDDWATNKMHKNPDQIINNYWNNSLHNLVLMWDKHHLNYKNTAANTTTILVPALAWKWEYDTRLWLSSNPWFIAIINDEWLPEITSKQLADNSVQKNWWINYENNFNFKK